MLFLLDGSDFGIDPAKSSIRLRGEPGQQVLEILISGDQSTYNELSAPEDSQWHGTLYPPEFQLYGVRCEQLEGFSTDLPGDHDRNNLEIALYMLQHRSFVGTLSIVDSTVELVGEVHPWGERTIPLHLTWRFSAN